MNNITEAVKSSHGKDEKQTGQLAKFNPDFSCRKRLIALICLIGSGLLFASVPVSVADDYVSVKKYLPREAQLDGTTDCTAAINQALAENLAVILPGSGDEEKPFIYAIKGDGTIKKRKPALTLPNGHLLKAEKGAVILRLPFAGAVLRSGENCRITGLVINGNKKAHWPAFQDLGKGDFGIQFGGNNLIEDCYIYNNPGIAFGTFENDSLVRRCRVKNAGYIDLKFKANFYQGKWDNWSGDGFYLRGHNNVAMDCYSEDAFRWDYTTCHGKSGGATYIRCKGVDRLWRSYGFIDIEGCSGAGSVMIDCDGAEGGDIAISTSGSILINSSGLGIHNYDADDLVLVGNTTHGKGLSVGGWSSSFNKQVRGGNNPVVVANTINRSGTGVGTDYCDWSFGVFSSDGRGIVAGNLLNEFKSSSQTGPGVKFDKVQEFGNTIAYGEYKGRKIDNQAGAAREKQNVEMGQARLQQFIGEVPFLAEKLGLKGPYVQIMVPPLSVKFAIDKQGIGLKEEWFVDSKRPAANTLREIRIGEHWDGQIGGPLHKTPGWYFIDFPLDGDLQHNGNTFHLLFSGVDSECQVYLNGQKIGEHEGWKDPFLIEVPFKLLHWEGTDKLNNLTVRVYTPLGLGGIYRNIAGVLTKK